MLVSLRPSVRCTRHGGTFDFEFHEEALGRGSPANLERKFRRFGPEREECSKNRNSYTMVRNGTIDAVCCVLCLSLSLWRKREREGE